MNPFVLTITVQHPEHEPDNRDMLVMDIRYTIPSGDPSKRGVITQASYMTSTNALALFLRDIPDTSIIQELIERLTP
jgi:hypothetical protein